MKTKMDYGKILDAASRRWEMSKKMKCQAKTQAILLDLTDAASKVWITQYRSKKDRQK